MSKQIALVVEAVEDFTRTDDCDYYVRVTLGLAKVGTHSVSAERNRLTFLAHTMLPREAAESPDLSIEIIEASGTIVGARVVKNWKSKLQGADKCVLVANVYEPAENWSRTDSPLNRPGEIPIPKLGTIRLRVYLAPVYERTQKKYDRLDICVSKITDLIIDELIEKPPHVLLRLGDQNGQALTSNVVRGVDDEGEWIWDEIVSFQYSGESEVYFSVRDSATDQELGKAVLFISQIAYVISKEANAAILDSKTGRAHHPKPVNHKRAGNIHICDQRGATVGMILVGAELWNSDDHFKHISLSANRPPNHLELLDKRLEFDENLLRYLNDPEAGGILSPVQMSLAQASVNGASGVDGSIARATGNSARELMMTQQPTVKDISLPGEQDRLHIEGKLADAKNFLQEAQLIRLESRTGLKSRRDLKHCHHRELAKIEATEHTLTKAESRIYALVLDRAQELSSKISKIHQNSHNIIMRCQQDAKQAPRRLNASVVSAGSVSAIAEIERISRLLQENDLQSTHHKNTIRDTPKLNTVPSVLEKLTGIYQSSKVAIQELSTLNLKIQEQIEAVRQENRLDMLRQHEQMFMTPPPIIVERTGLNCFACCQSTFPQDNLYEFQEPWGVDEHSPPAAQA